MDDLRLFISVNIDNNQIKSKIAEFQEQVDVQGVKLVDPELFHFSLHFLGDISKELVPELNKVLSSIRQVPFSVGLQGIGVFPSLYNIKVIWAGVSAGSDELRNLKQQLDEPLEQLGFTIDSRPFTPHLTIGRVKFLNPENKSKLQKIISDYKATQFGSQEVLALNLMQSTLKPEGPNYQSLFRQDLKD